MGKVDLYVMSYDQLQQFKTWCSGYTIFDKYGFVMPLTRWGMFDSITEDNWESTSDFPDHRHLVYSAPDRIAYFIIHHCKLDFIQEQLKRTYSDKYDKVKSDIKYANSVMYNFSDVVMARNGNYGTHFKIYKMRLHTNRNNPVNSNCWQIRIYKDKKQENSTELQFVMYSVPKNNNRIGTWDNINDIVDCEKYSEVCENCRTIKALTRRIRKWRLPVGTILYIEDKEEVSYKVIIK